MVVQIESSLRMNEFNQEDLEIKIFDASIIFDIVVRTLNKINGMVTY